ncbi:helix-turn-helix domain-containing protein [Kitasatospora sp. NPDC008115]|uniref:helix-turn-helix domain-containing protein n=1 Tax=Kitasatospora sp. NPDC008115 TaxID=3364022 RepID=UPI0036E0E327
MARRQAPLEGDGAAARFAERLRQARRDSGLTLRQLAAVSGYSHSTLSLAESGRRLPTWEVAEAFAQACGRADVDRWRGWWEAAEEQCSALSEAAGTEPVATGAEAEPDPGSGKPGPVVVVRTRWWALLLAVVLSSVLTATITLALAPERGAARNSSEYPPGRDAIPTESCGGAKPGYGCAHKDPNDSGCWDDHAEQGHITEIEYQGGVVGKLVNWYSPRCGTNWAALHIRSGWQGRVTVRSPTDSVCFPEDCTTMNGKTPPFWTAMVFGMNRPIAARAEVEFPDGQVRTVIADTT